MISGYEETRYNRFLQLAAFLVFVFINRLLKMLSLIRLPTGSLVRDNKLLLKELFNYNLFFVSQGQKSSFLTFSSTDLILPVRYSRL